MKPKIILISGGSRGLGEGVVRHLLTTTNHQVITFSRKESPFIKRLLSSQASLSFPRKRESIDRSMDPRFRGDDIKSKAYWNDMRERFMYRQLDISNSKEIENLFSEIKKRYGRLDVLINNAAIGADGILAVFPESEIDKVLNINLNSVIKLSRHAARIMIRQNGGGTILNISSVAGLRGFSGLSVYSASKAGLIGFTRSLARELGNKKIRVNAIAPGYFETEMSASLSKEHRQNVARRTPLGRLGKIEDILPTIDLLISENSAFITGQTFVIDGGISC